MQKPLVFVGQNEDACFCAMSALEIDIGRVLGGKLTRKREPRQAKTGQERRREGERGREGERETERERRARRARGKSSV